MKCSMILIKSALNESQNAQISLQALKTVNTHTIIQVKAGNQVFKK